MRNLFLILLLVVNCCANFGVTHTVRPGDKWTEYGYDGRGNVIRETQHDGSESLYLYDADGLLLKAVNGAGHVVFSRDRSGRTVEESLAIPVPDGGENRYAVRSEYAASGDRLRITSSFGADLGQQFDADGNLTALNANQSWQAEWRRDTSGLELYRSLTGGVEIRTERDSFGRETRQSIGGHRIEQHSRRYDWGTGNRLQGVFNETTGAHTTFNYDAPDFLVRADYAESGKPLETVYRSPDPTGCLYETHNRTDRKYDRGGRLLEDPNHYYHYDGEGNLIFKEFRKPQGQPHHVWNRKLLLEKYGITAKGTMTGWLYEWNASGMLEKVTNPSLGKITFGYDALGRRLWKESKGVRTCWLWDGNVPLHEWTETEAKPDIDLITWVFDEGGFTPVARLTETGSESIVTDYLGTPAMMFDADGKKTWSADLDIYGRVRTFAGRSLTSCPFRYQGQYQDAETGLYYNRFRYYDPGSGNYISQDPIGLLGDDLRLYSYVYDSNDGIDPFGLYNPYGNKKDGQFKKKPGRKPTLKPSVHGNAKLSTKPAVLYVMYDEQGNFQKWGITDKVNNPKVGRYGNSLPEGWTVEEMARGKRSDMLKLERELSEKLGGDLNKESWAKTKQGESLSPEADKIATKAGVHH